MNLSTLYDADARTKDPVVARIAAEYSIPHPLHGIQYADGVQVCNHARRCITVTGQPAIRATLTRHELTDSVEG